MKALAHLSVLGMLILNAAFNEAYAGGTDGGTRNSGPAPLVRRELVGPDLLPATSNTEVLMREVRKTADGYEVKVKAADGSLRMKGTYSDEQLTQANGLFSFYHDNGQLESEGRIVNGLKTGLWTRFDRSGNAMSERIYDGRTYDQLAVSHGWSAPVN